MLGSNSLPNDEEERRVWQAQNVHPVFWASTCSGEDTDVHFEWTLLSMCVRQPALCCCCCCYHPVSNLLRHTRICGGGRLLRSAGGSRSLINSLIIRFFLGGGGSSPPSFQGRIFLRLKDSVRSGFTTSSHLSSRMKFQPWSLKILSTMIFFL